MKPDCSAGLTNVPAKETVKVRKTTKLSGTAVGQVNKGRKAFICNDGKSFKGQWVPTSAASGAASGCTSTRSTATSRATSPRACMKWSSAARSSQGAPGGVGADRPPQPRAPGAAPGPRWAPLSSGRLVPHPLHRAPQPLGQLLGGGGQNSGSKSHCTIRPLSSIT
ncbi:hypothetical protein SALBM135S_06102 [Streptomyces alboniger]